VSVDKPNLNDSLGAGILSEELEPTPVQKAIEKRLDAFDRYKDVLLPMLQQVCERRPKIKSFDKEKAWKHLRFIALTCVAGEADTEKRKTKVSDADRAELLRQLGNTLSDAHSKVKKAKQTVLAPLFVQWCITHGNPDFTDPIIETFEREFEKEIVGIVEGLAALATPAFEAAKEVRERIPPRRGRPPGTSFPGHGVILGLERVYRESTGEQAGAGKGPFARFVSKFLEALGRKSTEQRIIEAIKAAKKREEKNPAKSRWGRPQASLATFWKPLDAKR
jgi:hypothetical protein